MGDIHTLNILDLVGHRVGVAFLGRQVTMFHHHTEL